jgi:hypothetical protein
MPALIRRHREQRRRLGRFLNGVLIVPWTVHSQTRMPRRKAGLVLALAHDLIFEHLVGLQDRHVSLIRRGSPQHSSQHGGPFQRVFNDRLGTRGLRDLFYGLGRPGSTGLDGTAVIGEVGACAGKERRPPVVLLVGEEVASELCGVLANGLGGLETIHGAYGGILSNIWQWPRQDRGAYRASPARSRGRMIVWVLGEKGTLPRRRCSSPRCCWCSDVPVRDCRRGAGGRPGCSAR